MHWCAAKPIDFHYILAQARRHHVNELDGEQQDERRLCPVSDMEPSNPTRPMPPHVFVALQQILEHYYRDELEHYENAGAEQAVHIFHALNRLKKWAAA